MKLTAVKLKTITLIAFAVCSMAGFAQVEKTIYVMQNGEVVFESPVSDIDSIIFYNPDEAGVEINGVVWATRNVGAPGTFVENPEDYGGYYQFNRGTTDFLLDNDYWAGDYAQSNSWLPANDPAPAGWRVPNLTEIQKLCDKNNVSSQWITLNGINGRKFADKTNGNSIFLPAAGYRYGGDSTLDDIGASGFYWVSATIDTNNACSLYFSSGPSGWYLGSYRSNSLSVRPVAD